MRKLLSLPPSLVPHFHEVSGLSRSEYFCTSDPVGHRVGSGGGTVHLLHAAASDPDFRFRFSPTERCIVLHAGGQSRRLPAYASAGKILTPMPPLGGEPFGKSLLELQLPLFERIMAQAPASLRCLIVSGDVYISAAGALPPIPEADVVCYGIPASAERLSHHGVYALPKSHPLNLDFMLQKPSLEEQAQKASTHNLLLDVGLWLLSERALHLLEKKSVDAQGAVRFYDLYGQFGTALGMHPTAPDEELSELSVVILPLPEGRFLHFGTSRDLLTSTVLLTSQPNPDLRWVENSDVRTWTLSRENIVTGVPDNSWPVRLSSGQCVDITPITAPPDTSVPCDTSDTAESSDTVNGTRHAARGLYALRPYGFDDAFRGSLVSADTLYLGIPVARWLSLHGLSPADIEGAGDMQSARLFPVSADEAQLCRLLLWMLSEQPDASLTQEYLACRRLSADEISNTADLRALTAQRIAHRRATFQSEVAFGQLRQQLFDLNPLPLMHPDLAGLQRPVLGTSPLRIDVSGGWTDTPPACYYYGGSVVNFAFDIDGSAPIRCTISPVAEPLIRLRSLDLDAVEEVTTWTQLSDFAHLGSPFTISKAALALAGWLPRFASVRHASLLQQLGGCGFEVTTESRVPAGSGLGTSSILAATVLGTVSAAFSLGWSREQVCQRTLVLEQMLTAGGGWQDQWGGVVPGAKLLSTSPGADQRPVVHPLCSLLWTHPRLAPCHLLYFTGITRTARQILGEIVKEMFLRVPGQRAHLERMRLRASEMAAFIDECASIPPADTAALDLALEYYGHLVAQNWEDNQGLDAGCNPPAVRAIIGRVQHLCHGLKLPGAGGGGFIYMVAKNAKAAGEIRSILTDNPPAPSARFFEMSLSEGGLTFSCGDPT